MAGPSTWGKNIDGRPSLLWQEEETNLNNHDQTEDEIILNALLSLPDLKTRAANLQTLAHSLFAVKSPKSQANYRRNRKRFISVGAIVIGLVI
ncbi:unnamed protein product, partial [Didymodactylos carnosus]